MKIMRNKLTDRLRPPALSGLKYTEGKTFVHRLHPLAKLIFLITFTLTIFITNNYLKELILLLVVLLSYRTADLGLNFFLKKLKFILLFSLTIFVIQIFFNHEGRVLWMKTLCCFSLEIYSEGVKEGLNLALRFFNIIAISFLFISTTPPNKLVYALMQLGIPYRFCFMLITALRFIPVYQNDFFYVRCAQQAKGISFKGISWRTLKRAIHYLFVPLIIINLLKVDSLAVSMESRAFGLYPQRSYMVKEDFRWQDALFSIFFCLFFLFLIMI